MTLMLNKRVSLDRRAKSKIFTFLQAVYPKKLLECRSDNYINKHILYFQKRAHQKFKNNKRRL